MAHTSLVRVLVCAALTLSTLIGSVSSQVNLCQTLDNTGVALPQGSVGQPSNPNACCLSCQQSPGCGAALYQAIGGLCFLIGGQLDEDQLIPNTANSMVIFPNAASAVAANGDDGVPDDAVIFGLRVPAVVGIVAAFIMVICICLSSIAFCRARSKQNANNAVLNSEFV